MAETTIAIRVSCYAGHRGEEMPSHFFLKTRKVEVVEVIDRWLAPGHRYFKVRAGDGDVYILRHDVTEEQWEMVFYSSAEIENQDQV